MEYDIDDDIPRRAPQRGNPGRGRGGFRGQRGRGGRGGGRGARGGGRGGRGGHGGAEGDMASAQAGGRGGGGRGGRGGHGGEGDMAPPQGRRQQREHRVRRMGYHKLEELARKDDPSDVLLTVSSVQNGFLQLLEADSIQSDWMSLILRILNKALQCNTSRNLSIQLLNAVRTSKFFKQHITTYFLMMRTESPMKQLTYKQPIKCYIALCKSLLTMMPSEYNEVFASLTFLNYNIKELQKDSMAIDESILAEMKEVIEMCESRVTRNQKRAQNMSRRENDDDELAPPDDFREIGVFPTADDLSQTEKPFLRANKVHGAYKSIDHYLDIQFRLLREDFIRPLRDGIQEYLSLLEKGTVNRRLQDIKLYHDVHILYPVCNNNGLSYRIRFDIYPLKKVRWQSTRRLIYGSLVCLSRNNFEDMLFATVINRDPKSLSEGELEVQFENNGENVADIDSQESFLMAETSAFFEAYRHVLEAIKGIDGENMPFQNHIVQCEKETNPPAYLTANHTVDLSPLFNPDIRVDCDTANYASDSDEYSDDDEVLQGILNRQFARKRIEMQKHKEKLRKVPAALKHVDILDRRQWPSAESLQLDDSQMRALKAALTRELAIIQGPPGTGKTYLGLKVVKSLLYNKQIWHPTRVGLDESRIKNPILVVCYTNHALDQFLEGIHQFHSRGIVRVGGRSKSEILQKDMLREWRRSYSERKAFPSNVISLYFDAKTQMDTLDARMSESVAQIEIADRGVIHEDILNNMGIMEDMHYSTVVQHANREWQHKKGKGRQSKLMDWLGLGRFIYTQELNQATFGIQERRQQNPNVPQDDEDDELEVEEEATFIADQRMGDNEDEDFRKKEKMREKINQVQADRQLALDLNDLDQDEFDYVNDEQWQVQKTSRKKNKQKIKRELTKTDRMTEEEVLQVQNVWTLHPADRWRMYRYWLAQYKHELKLSIRDYEMEYQRASERMKEARDQKDMFIMQSAVIIGMTTTCAARYRNVLQQVKPKIIIVEEAAEVLEAHIITTLSEGCEHLILIGDHQQLRPNPTVYELAEKFNLKISLFERLIKNGYPVVTLENQHRMRPEISSLLINIYPKLNDHESVLEYDNVKGISNNMYFIDHRHPEEGDEELKSKSNSFEAQYIAKLCRYLILQGYERTQITVLTPYTGQLFQLRKYMKPKQFFDGVRVTAVDNFQGEENDIILLSLVRSNNEGKLGFLQEDNRVCVLLSRAKKGFYVVGNMEMLSVKTALWANVLGDLKKSKSVGPGLNLYCQNHPTDKIVARDHRDFDRAPEGGCTRPCETRLDCGHVCTLVCHSYDRDHTEYQCRKLCNKDMKCDYGHKCRKQCWQVCGDCETPVPRIMSQCGHRQNVPCYLKTEDFSCKAKCEVKLSCGHDCQEFCGDPHTLECRVMVTRVWPCGHEVLAECHHTPETYPCPQICSTRLNCEHQCSGSCGRCLNGRLHKSCTARCDRTLVCGHHCKTACTKNCPPCSEKCQNRCVHSVCQKRCGDPCQPCMEPCNWKCRHYQCTKLCHESCDRPRCDEPCRKRLKCGHMCIGMCGEKCPKLCRVCNKDQVEEIFFGDEDEADTRFVELEDCGHVVSVEGLDYWMDQAEDMQGGKQVIQLKACPKCKTPIRRNLRYGKIINRILRDIEKVKEAVAGDMTGAEDKRQRLMRKARNLGRQDELASESFKMKLDIKSMTPGELADVENLIGFYVNLVSMTKKIVKNLISSSEMNVRESLQSQIERMKKWVLDTRDRISEQELGEAGLEVTRIVLLVDAHVLQHIIKERNVKLEEDMHKNFKKTIKLLSKLNEPLKEDYAEACRTILKRVEECTPRTGLGITDQERVEIVKAMGLSQGHWYKCPKGHVYAIGDCGGATIESRCPECNASIGGSGHRLRSDNALAPEMDGARHAAWSEQANLANYEELRLGRLNLAD